MTGILDGVRLLDLTSGLAGPVATLFLAEAGAEVIKIEPPDGDHLRGTPAFATWNRSKRSIALDLDRREDRLVLDGLLEGADVLVHSLGRREAERLGLDPRRIGEQYPHVIVCMLQELGLSDGRITQLQEQGVIAQDEIW